VELGRDWGLSGGRDCTGLCSVIPRLLNIVKMSGPERIDDRAPRIRITHDHKKTFDLVFLCGGEIAQQTSRTVHWVFA